LKNLKDLTIKFNYDTSYMYTIPFVNTEILNEMESIKLSGYYDYWEHNRQMHGVNTYI